MATSPDAQRIDSRWAGLTAVTLTVSNVVAFGLLMILLRIPILDEGIVGVGLLVVVSAIFGVVGTVGLAIRHVGLGGLTGSETGA